MCTPPQQVHPDGPGGCVSVADEWRANWLSRATWWWIGPLLRLGYSRPLQMNDLGVLDTQDRSSLLASKMTTALSAQSDKITFVRRLWNVLARFELYIMVLAGIGKLFGDLLGFVGPLSLAGIINFCTISAGGQRDTIWPYEGFPGAMERGYWWMIAALVSAILQNLFLHQHHHYAIRAGMHVRSALTILVYRKALKLTPSARAKFGTGFITNAASVDANGVGMVFWYIHYAWAAPIQLAICLAMLYSQLGPSAFVGLAVLLALLPVQASLGKRIGEASKRTMTHSDTRIKLINEIVSGIRILKFMAWESSFAGRVADARSKEVQHKRTVALISAANSTLLEVGPLFVALLTFLTYGYTAGEPLSASRAFTALSLYSILRLPLMVVPMLIGAWASASVAASRIASFLEAPEQVEYRTLVAPSPKAHLSQRALAVKCSSSMDATDSTSPSSPSLGHKEAAVVDEPAVEFVDATLNWEGAAENGKETSGAAMSAFHLRGLTLAIPAGKLTTIVGPVGSGKSSLLSAILGEMTFQQGSVTLRLPTGSAVSTQIAYCSQQPWIVNASVKDNITFGQALDEKRYKAAVHACALEPDLAVLPSGDDTEIGERGVNLSGGQKARISLARAVYSYCPCVLLDDVLSAVDAHVAQHLWTHALTGPDGLAGRTVILVSHQLQFVPRSDMVVVLQAGRIAQAGGYAQLMAERSGVGESVQVPVCDDGGQSPAMSVEAETAASPDSVGVTIAATMVSPQDSQPRGAPGGKVSPTNLLAAMMAERRKVDEELAAADENRVSGQGVGVVGKLPKEGLGKAGGAVVPSIAGVPAPVSLSPASPSATARIIVDEDRALGEVPTSIYWTYLSAMGPVCGAVIVLTLLASNAARIGTDVWLGIWSTDSLGREVGFYVAVYAGITLSSSLLTLAMGWAWAVGGLQAALTLHNDMFARVLRSPVSFFDTTPTGRILNRFSSDIAIVDKDLPTSFSSFAKLTVSVLGTVVVQAIIVPFTLLASVPVAGLFLSVQTYFRHSAREVKRLDQISKSPVFAHLAESLQGLPSIRAYGVTNAFVLTAERRVDTNNVANWKSNLMNRWLGLRLDAVGALLVGGVCLVAVLTAGRVNPGLIGLAISYAMSVTGTLNWLVRSGSETETHLASVERVATYSALPTESPAVVEGARPPVGWPRAGAVTFDNLCVKYRPGLPQVLSNISLSVTGGHKVGVCGRTGSGKSSLMLALFRIVEPCVDSEDKSATVRQPGRILVDGVDVHAMGLDDLRSHMAIIPQDPTLFNGTMRYNLDPTGSILDDETLWAALSRVRLEEVVQAVGGLDGAVADGGGNLSVGQRQLVCLARALLRKSRILVLDEATASVDVQTDALIQTELRSAFADATAFIIAHRINTILDCDRVLVLDGGKVAEYGPPGDLLRNEGSLFAQLVKNSAEAGTEASAGSATSA